jgi:hypothetical protein
MAAPSDAIVLEVAVLELPLSDRAQLAAVWTAADEQIVPPTHKARLEDNGLRAGLIGGIPPSAFQNLLISERTNPSPHQWLKKSGDARVLPLGAPLAECRFDLATDGATTPVVLERAQCALHVTPRTTTDGVKLKIVPQIQHGHRTLQPMTEAAGGWSLPGQRPMERYTALSFDVRLGGPEFLILGASEKPQSLGQVCFQGSGERPIQRLVVIRASRPNGGTDSLTSSDRGMAPLAAQAAASRARGAMGQ